MFKVNNFVLEINIAPNLKLKKNATKRRIFSQYDWSIKTEPPSVRIALILIGLWALEFRFNYESAI